MTISKFKVDQNIEKKEIVVENNEKKEDNIQLEKNTQEQSN
jgi:hypothetical protein